MGSITFMLDRNLVETQQTYHQMQKRFSWICLKKWMGLEFCLLKEKTLVLSSSFDNEKQSSTSDSLEESEVVKWTTCD
jgi:hypothetical protein